MRDLVAGIVAVLLLFVAASLATTLTAYRRRREGTRDSERALGRRIIAELPISDDLVLVTEDDKRFYYGDRSIDKDLIVAVRVLINGATIAEYVSPRHAGDRASARSGAGPVVGIHAEQDRGAGVTGRIEDHFDAIARERWDVAVETLAGATLIECGGVRERVSQELARKVFEAIKRAI